MKDKQKIYKWNKVRLKNLKSRMKNLNNKHLIIKLV
jgi:hypothetical protein